MNIRRKIFIPFLVILFGCNTSYQYPKFDYIKSTGANPCITAFKDRVFYCIMRESLKGTNAISEISKKDVGNTFEGIYSAELFRRIDTIGQNFVKNMPPPVLCDECVKGQNYYIAQALHFYTSRDLDSIAKIELQKFGMYKCK
ncbi:hypothetical protein [Pedobacter suwonensis]|uniref:hypothetical protein n=1 Tax=Pedobacter suwonensis TaxID=332999 RepID=UPI0025EF66AB|nr:hypothetical protein [uncultured Pedobacter sp.]